MSGLLWGRFDLPAGFDPLAVTRSNGRVTHVYRTCIGRVTDVYLKCNGRVLLTDVWSETLVLTKVTMGQV